MYIRSSVTSRAIIRIFLIFIVPILAFLFSLSSYKYMALLLSFFFCFAEQLRLKFKGVSFVVFLAILYLFQLAFFVMYVFKGDTENVLKKVSIKENNTSIGNLRTDTIINQKANIQIMQFNKAHSYIKIEKIPEENNLVLLSVATIYDGINNIGKENYELEGNIEDESLLYENDLRTVSIILPALNEQKYLQRTLESIVNATNLSLLKEIIIVDDYSDSLLINSYNATQFPPNLIRFVRNEARFGLVVCKIIGANNAKGDIIIFFDAHVRPENGWLIPILFHINLNYKRLVMPAVAFLDEETWEINKNKIGYKMMFDWNFNFNWFDDNNDYVPIVSGGILAISKKWWNESGMLDDKMLHWGGENIEQSIRIWLCGGEIVVARNSIVGHLFRTAFPYKVEHKILQRNKIRFIETWTDEYKEIIYQKNPVFKNEIGNIGDISERQKLKERLQCKNFQYFIDTFKDVFWNFNLLPLNTFLIQERFSKKCISAVNKVDNAYLSIAPQKNLLHLTICNSDDNYQRFYLLKNNISITNVGTKACIDAGNPIKPQHEVLLSMCEQENKNQVFNFHEKYGRITHGSYCLHADNISKVLLDSCKKGNHGIKKGEAYKEVYGYPGQAFDFFEFKSMFKSNI